MKNCLDNVIYLLLTCTTLNPRMGILFAWTYFYLWESFFIHDHLQESFFLSVIICENVFLSVRISCYPYASIFICEDLFLSIINNENLTLKQNPLRRNWMFEQLSGLLIRVTGTPPWLLRFVRVSNSYQLYPDCFRLSTFLDCSGIQFFDPPSFSQHSQLGHLWSPTSHCAVPVWLTGRCATPLVTSYFAPSPVPASAMDLRERFLLSGVFYLTLLPAVFKASLGAGRLAGLHAYLRNIAPAQPFVWITAIHKRFTRVGSI